MTESVPSSPFSMETVRSWRHKYHLFEVIFAEIGYIQSSSTHPLWQAQKQTQFSWLATHLRYILILFWSYISRLVFELSSKSPTIRFWAWFWWKKNRKIENSYLFEMYEYTAGKFRKNDFFYHHLKFQDPY